MFRKEDSSSKSAPIFRSFGVGLFGVVGMSTFTEMLLLTLFSSLVTGAFIGRAFYLLVQKKFE